MSGCWCLKERRAPRRTAVAVLALMLGGGLPGCNRTSTLPTRPSQQPPDAGTPPPAAVGPGVRGTVYDTAFRRLAGATVEVLDGPQAGMKVNTTVEGEFTLPGLFDATTRFQASSEGYQSATMLHPHGYMDYYLVRSMPPMHIAGEYDMTFVADPECAALPEYLRERTYRASVTPGSFDRIPAGMVLNLALAGVEPLDNPSIGVAGDTVGFRLFNDGYPFIVERVSASLYVTITGWAEVASWPADNGGVSVPFDGWMTALEGPPLSAARTLGHCKSSGHRLVIRPG